MKARELQNLGIPRGPVMDAARRCLSAAARAGVKKADLRERIRRLVRDPDAFAGDEHFASLADALRNDRRSDRPAFVPRTTRAPWRQWGDDLDPQSIQQMTRAAELPVAVAGALMPDAHVGYGLPIGGVLATDNAVIPYAVGVDIACRMKMTVLDLPVKQLESEHERLTRAIEHETRFGIGASFRKPRDHDVMDRDWSVTDVTQKNRDKARSQLGTSGSGNHFVEFGTFTLPAPDLGLDAGTYLALLSHSGSRGPGAAVASHYSNLAMRQHPELPKELRHLAWLDLDSAEGGEYWTAMNLMGEYAAANHAMIHRHIARHLGAAILADIENHHNFAWQETHRLPDGTTRAVIVHRKGATPAGKNVLGIIPGSMASPGYVVRGRGEDRSLHSASHGAGRVMSRRQARTQFTRSQLKRHVADAGVRLLSAGLDEAPFVYKDIDTVMSMQRDLVETVGRFDPKLVKMAPDGERPED